VRGVVADIGYLPQRRHRVRYVLQNLLRVDHVE
jgi:hypothetical protein